jgi:hypothetical protein
LNYWHFCSSCLTAAEQSSHIRDLIVRYADVQLAQLQQTAACNALHEAPARLCRWLLQTSDKIASDTIPFTHEFLADMLAVRRSTISQIASAFQDCWYYPYRPRSHQAPWRKTLARAMRSFVGTYRLIPPAQIDLAGSLLEQRLATIITSCVASCISSA